MSPLGQRVALVLEDDATFRKLLTTMVRHAGFEPLPAASVEAAETLLASGSPSVVIADVSLGNGQSGLQFCRRIMAMPIGKRPFVVVVTGMPGPGVVDEAREVQADAFVRKPFRVADLVALLSRAER